MIKKCVGDGGYRGTDPGEARNGGIGDRCIGGAPRLLQRVDTEESYMDTPLRGFAGVAISRPRFGRDLQRPPPLGLRATVARRRTIADITMCDITGLKRRESWAKYAPRLF